MSKTEFHLGDLVNALFPDSIERDGRIVQIDGHLVSIETDNGTFNTALSMCRKI